MTSRRKGWSLAELLAVVAIVAILVAALGLLIAPRIKARAVETRIKSDLRQLAIATNVYLADNDGAFPIHFRLKHPEDLPGAPFYCLGCARFSPVPSSDPFITSPTATLPYSYLWHAKYQRMERRAAGRLRYPYDPHTGTLFEAPWFRRPLGKVDVEFFSAPGVPRPMKWEQNEILGVRLDGSVHWKREVENWQFERAAIFGL